MCRYRYQPKISRQNKAAYRDEDGFPWEGFPEIPHHPDMPEYVREEIDMAIMGAASNASDTASENRNDFNVEEIFGYWYDLYRGFLDKIPNEMAIHFKTWRPSPNFEVKKPGELRDTIRRMRKISLEDRQNLLRIYDDLVIKQDEEYTKEMKRSLADDITTHPEFNYWWVASIPFCLESNNVDDDTYDWARKLGLEW